MIILFFGQCFKKTELSQNVINRRCIAKFASTYILLK